MKKIPTLFKREFEGHNVVRVLPELSDPSLQWVLDGEGIATVKYDGSCCAIIDGKFYLRYDAKNGKPVPENAIKCQEEPDPVTGHLPCWIPYNENDPSHKWYGKAYENYKAETKTFDNFLEDGTYEAVGFHFNGNPYNMYYDILIPHGKNIITTDELNPFGCRTFEGIKDYLEAIYVEGIVFWKDGEPKCKIKRSDFGFEWQPKKR